MKYISLDGLKRAFEQIVNYVKAQIKSNVTDKLGVASGIATLGTDGKLTSGLLPSIDKTYVGLGNVTNEAQIPLSQKGAASGVATLGTDGKVPSAQLPSYVDDVLEYASKSTFPATGETGKIYVDTSDNKTYRWSGTAYTEISASLALGETSSTAYPGDKGKDLQANFYDLLDRLYGLQSAFMTIENTINTIDNYDLLVSGSSETRLTENSVEIAIQNLDINGPSTAVETINIPAATESKAGVMLADDKTKLNGIATGAEVNQNAFSNVVVGSTTIAADSKTDSLTLAAGTNVTITPDATNDKITIAAKDTTYGVATTSADGLMSAADKTKLDGIVTATDTEIDAIFAEVTA